MFIVMTSAARMPKSCYGHYRNVAVVETDGSVPKFISERARGVKRVVHHFGPQHVSSSERCAYRQALKWADELICQLLQEQQLAEAAS